MPFTMNKEDYHEFIEMDHIRKTFGSLEVLKDVTLHVETGEVISIIGPSGSGKSTFLRCLCQLETINSGSIVVDGQTMVSTPEGSNRAVYAPGSRSPGHLPPHGHVLPALQSLPAHDRFG